MGVLFTNDGERLSIIDEKGRIIDGDDLLTIFSVMVARTRERARIAVPVTAPAKIEQLVELHSGRTSRTKTDVRSLMAVGSAPDKKTPAADFAGDTRGGFVFSEFQPAFDSMFAFGKLLEMLAKTGLSLGQLVDELPPSHVVTADVRCPWEEKGRIMRELTKEAEAHSKIELIDGIKVYDGDAWALVLPDASDPYFHIYAEAETKEQSQALVQKYVERIEGLRG
jgi:mannose-1-phosphate guanylyltransferase/phosphomannomutase